MYQDVPSPTLFVNPYMVFLTVESSDGDTIADLEPLLVVGGLHLALLLRVALGERINVLLDHSNSKAPPTLAEVLTLLNVNTTANIRSGHAYDYTSDLHWCFELSQLFVLARH